jgi:hypothetical protein
MGSSENSFQRSAISRQLQEGEMVKRGNGEKEEKKEKKEFLIYPSPNAPIPNILS